METSIDEEYDQQILVLGVSAVGKSCVLTRFAKKVFDPTLRYTVGNDVFVRNMIMQDSKKIKITIWDTAGMERHYAVPDSMYRGIDSVIFVYDVSDRNSFKKINQWMEVVDDHIPTKTFDTLRGRKCYLPCKLLIGNKIDIRNDAEKELKDENLDLKEEFLKKQSRERIRRRSKINKKKKKKDNEKNGLMRRKSFDSNKMKSLRLLAEKNNETQNRTKHQTSGDEQLIQKNKVIEMDLNIVNKFQPKTVDYSIFVSTDEGMKKAEKYNMLFMETSAKTGEKVKEAIEMICNYTYQTMIHTNSRSAITERIQGPDVVKDIVEKFLDDVDNKDELIKTRSKKKKKCTSC